MNREFSTRYTKCNVCLNNASIIIVISDLHMWGCELVAVMFWFCFEYLQNIVRQVNNYAKSVLQHLKW